MEYFTLRIFYSPKKNHIQKLFLIFLGNLHSKLLRNKQNKKTNVTKRTTKTQSNKQKTKKQKQQQKQKSQNNYFCNYFVY